jgi:FAD:protein FMN transferase
MAPKQVAPEQVAAELVSSERVFGAMGTTVHLIGVGAAGCAAETADLLEAAEARVHHLEAQWSRFRPTSELSRLNQRPGAPTTVTSETYDLVTAAVAGWVRTAGLFDPTLIDAVEAAGYERSFEALPADRSASALTRGPRLRASAGCAEIGLDPDSRAVCLPHGTRLDLGGIAKGRAADLIVADLADAGLEGACANLGGDVRAWGRGPEGASGPAGAWRIDIQDPTGSAAPLAMLEIDDGAVVTSTRLRRRWLVDGVEHHHLIDPRTQRPAFNGWAQVSVVAGTATEAEVLAKALFLAGPQPKLLDEYDARAVLIADDGRVETIGFDAQPFS